MTTKPTIVSALPACDFCPQDGPKVQRANYDFKTASGQWANGCKAHWIQNRASAKLGTGHGQLLAVAKAEKAAAALVAKKPAKAKKPTSAGLQAASSTPDTRESWLRRAVPHLSMRIASAAQVSVPADVQVSVGFARGSKKAIGQCIDAQASVDGTTRNISICPTLADGVRVLDVLLHELIHAAVGCEHGHDKVFAQAARAVGLEGKPTATVANELLKADLTLLAELLGTYPHVAVKARPAVSKPEPGKSEWVRMYSKTLEGFLCNVRRDMIEEHGAPVDPTGDEMVFDKPW